MNTGYIGKHAVAAEKLSQHKSCCWFKYLRFNSKKDLWIANDRDESTAIRIIIIFSKLFPINSDLAHTTLDLGLQVSRATHELLELDLSRTRARLSINRV